MSLLRPFPAWRPRPDAAVRVACPPYDVIDSEEARVLVADNPDSFLRVGKSEVDLPPDTDPYSPAVYERARANFHGLAERGLLIRDGQASLTLYTLEQDGHSQTGVIGGFSVDEYREGTIRRHELTRREKEDDRTRHVATVGAQTGPALLAYRAEPALAALCARVRSRPADYDFIGVDGVRHCLHVIAAPDELEAFVTAFARIPRLYIADGHHRSAAAARVAAERNAERADAAADSPWNSFLAVAFPHDSLRILPYHRLVSDLGGLDAQAFLERLATVCRITPHADPTPAARHGFSFYLEGCWYGASFKEGVPAEPLAALDVSLLQERVLAPLLGIGDPRSDARIDFAGGTRGTGYLAAQVDSGAYAIAFSMFPTSLEELFAVADADGIMPPKSTWFAPKLLDGLVSHAID